MLVSHFAALYLLASFYEQSLSPSAALLKIASPSLLFASVPCHTTSFKESSPLICPKPTHLPARLCTPRFWNSINPYLLLYLEDHVFFFFTLLHIVKKKGGCDYSYFTACYSLCRFVTVLIDRLLFKVSVRIASFCIVPNDDQWNACAVSWINTPFNILLTALASVTCCSAVT